MSPQIFLSICIRMETRIKEKIGVQNLGPRFCISQTLNFHFFTEIALTIRENV